MRMSTFPLHFTIQVFIKIRLWVSDVCNSGSYTAAQLKPFKPYSALLITSHCALHREDSRFCVSRKGRTGGQHPQGVVHRWVLGLAVIGEWLAPGGAILDLSRQLECVKNHFSSCSNKLEQLCTCSYFVSVDN